MKSKHTPSQKRALAVATAFAIVLGIWFLRSYFSMLVIAGALTYLFYPLYSKLQKRMGNGSAASITLAVSLLTVIVPVILVGVLASAQIRTMIDNATVFFADFNTNYYGQKSLELVNSFLDKLPVSAGPINEATLIEGIKSGATRIGTEIIGGLARTATSFIGWFSAFIIYLFLFVSLLRNGPLLLDIFRKLNPLGEEISNVYLSRIGAMVRGTVFGQLMIALVQGFLGALAVAIAGYPGLFFIMFIIFTLLSIIPLGAGILALPIGVFMILFGNIWGGIIVIGEHLLINTNVDNVLRPILVPKEARLDAALMLLSVFAGIRIFGFLGMIVGPTMMILIVTTVKTYLEVFKQFTIEPAKSTRKQKA